MLGGQWANKSKERVGQFKKGGKMRGDDLRKTTDSEWASMGKKKVAKKKKASKTKRPSRKD